MLSSTEAGNRRGVGGGGGGGEGVQCPNITLAHRLPRLICWFL